MYSENIKLWKTVVSRCLPNKDNIIVTVCGDSMRPIICNGDKVKVILQKNDQYSIGDVIVFPYKDEGLIIHRLLKIQYGRYFCKGDNSFRIEDIPLDQVIGKAVISDDWHNSESFTERSLAIGMLYKKMGYKSSLIRETTVYREYEKTYLIK